MKLKQTYAAALMLSAMLTSAPVVSKPSQDIEEILVTASLTPIALSRSGNAVTVISRDQIKKSCGRKC
jgi:outer membrane cobalamin receptor